MKRVVFGFVAGLVFGCGLVIAGMSDPAKVLNFLDIAGDWDPSLAFVMAGATATTFLGYRLVWRMASPVANSAFDVPSAAAIDRPLIAGAVLFGLGWGISGFCPGPAWTALPMAATGTLAFIPAMLVGLYLSTRTNFVRKSTDR